LRKEPSLFPSSGGRLAGRLNEGDLMVWNAFGSKSGWRDFATPTLERAKKKAGISDRDDIATIPDLIDFDEDRAVRP